jgi:hypothetical protein
MSPELEEEIFKKYPRLFQREDPDGQRFGSSCYEFSCGDGWFHIIDTLCRNIQNYSDNHQDGLDQEDAEYYQVTVQQVKEKFGSLRFYISGGDDYIYGMISMAEAISEKTCEDCGAKAEVTTKGWIRNLCFKCNDKPKEEE